MQSNDTITANLPLEHHEDSIGVAREQLEHAAALFDIIAARAKRKDDNGLEHDSTIHHLARLGCITTEEWIHHFDEQAKILAARDAKGVQS